MYKIKVTVEDLTLKSGPFADLEEAVRLSMKIKKELLVVDIIDLEEEE